MINWRELQSKFPELISDFTAFVKQRNGEETIWHYTSNIELYSFFDQKGLILLLDFENFAPLPHFRAKIYYIESRKLEVLNTWFPDRPEAEFEGFKRCFEILNVQLNE